jgi:hypothetical protein
VDEMELQKNKQKNTTHGIIHNSWCAFSAAIIVYLHTSAVLNFHAVTTVTSVSWTFLSTSSVITCIFNSNDDYGPNFTSTIKIVHWNVYLWLKKGCKKENLNGRRCIN